MFLHLVDDEKFTDGSIALFETCDPGNHRYVMVCKEAGVPSRYIKNKAIQIIPKDSPEYKAIIGTLADYTAVFVYSFFNKYHLDITNRAPANATLVLFFGGGELLTQKKYWPTVMLPWTKYLYYKHRTLPWVKTNLKKYASLLRQGRFTALAQPFRKRLASGPYPAVSALDTNIEKAVARLDYIAPVIPEDYDQLKKMTPCKAELLCWNYTSGFSLDKMKDWRITGSNWLVGNAARYALNHVEMLRRLRKIKGHSGNLIVPLSYGDSELYKEDVQRAGRKWFGRRFQPVLEYMPIDRYYALLGTCSAAFFNTPRQHALGNIKVSLYLGARVFLRSENPVYQFLKRRGAIVFSIQTDIPCNAAEIDTPLDDKCIQKNREVITQIASDEALQEKTETMLAILKEK